MYAYHTKRETYYMSSELPDESVGVARKRRRASTAIKHSLRAVVNQVSLLNRQVCLRVDLKEVDMDCLEAIAQHGPLSPSTLARRAGLHPATVTGILDRLERGGWVVRERDPSAADRRAITVRALRDRNAELFGHYAGMNDAMDELCATYTDAELEVIADFLDRTAGAGHNATEELAGD